jgi:hypothetical protein
MTSTVPGIIAWPVITFMAITLAARWRWCRTNLYDTYYNNLMAWIMLAQLLREHDVEVVMSRSALMTVTTAQQLVYVAIIFASTEFIGFTMLWANPSPVETRRGHRYYRLAAVILSVAYLVAATRARVNGQTLEIAGGWGAILAWSFCVAMILVLAARAVWMFAAELGKSSQSRDLLLAVGGLLLGVGIAAGCLEALVLALTDQLGWTNALKFRLWFHGFEFFFVAVVAFIFGAVPLAVRLLCWLGLDRTSRAWNKLDALRLSMTTAVPESSFNLDHGDYRFQKTTLQLHQTVVEIRDAILQLRPYFRDLAPHELAGFFPANSVPTRERDAATQAFELAHAVKAKIAGATPGLPDVTTMARSRSTTLDEEVAELLTLAKWWKPACAATGQLAQTAPEVKASSPA